MEIMVNIMKMFLFLFSNDTICYSMAFHDMQKGDLFKHKLQLEIKTMKPAINDAFCFERYEGIAIQHVLLKNYIKFFVF